MMPDENSKGFTLIEFAIILTIVGLLVSTVLVGQELIRAANLRSTTAQFVQYKVAAKAFLSKYRYSPGDLPEEKAEAYELTAVSPCANSLTPGCFGDGDKYYEPEEMLNIFYHLSKAGMIKEDLTNYSSNEYAKVTGTLCSGDVTDTQNMYPFVKTNDGSQWYPMTWNGEPTTNTHYDAAYISDVALGIGLNIIECIQGATGVLPDPGWYKMTPLDSEWIDRKLDDGDGGQGIVQIWDDANAFGYRQCQGADRSYNLTRSTDNICQVKMRFF